MDNGTYPASPTGNVHVGDHENGCLICNMEFAFADGSRIVNTFWLTTKDGAINTRAIDTLKQIFGWDGADPFWLEDNGAAISQIPVELVIENESFTGKDGETRTAPKIKWVNPVGGSGGNKIANADRKTLMSKYGAKLRAVSGGTPAPKKTPPPVTKQPELIPPPSSKKPATPPSDINECWKALCDAMQDKPRPEVEAKWAKLIEAIHGDKAQDDFTPQDWGAVLNKIKFDFDNIPM